MAHTSLNNPLGQFSVDEPRPIKVVAIGAGYSGIIAGIRFRQRVQNLDFTVYDSNAGVGGTWFVNRYPGLACDIPSHSYLPTFEQNTDWSAFYATGPEILKYLESLVDKYALRPYIKLQHRVTCAKWNEESGKWDLTIKRPRLLDVAREFVQSNGKTLNKPNYEDWEEFQDTADVLFLGVGSLSRWSWPDVQGLESFSGKVIHSAQWNTGDGDGSWEKSVSTWTDKNVGVIGVGSSAIQIVAALQPKVKHLVNYVRGKTWISSVFVRDRLLELSGGEVMDNYTFTEQDKKAFADPDHYRKFRHRLESDLAVSKIPSLYTCRSQSAHPVTLAGNAIGAAARIDFEASMRQKLARKPWIADHIVPDFGVGCRRLTPGPGYLEALCEDNVDFIPSLIKRVTATGIETVDDKFQELDVIVWFDISFQLDFSIIGRGGISMKEHNTPHPRTYLSVAVDGFPNMFQALGPNSGVGAGNLLLIMERQVDYAVAATLKLQRERLKSMEVKLEAVEDFERYVDAYFPTTVFGSKCKSWYKAGKEEGRVVALWPGSSSHAAKVLANPRWEDYNYEKLDGIKNRFHWLGDGNTVADRDPEHHDSIWYMRPENIDYPPHN
ncbi:FAD/NAD-binding domain-containing protein [Crassisporium funariophilum]|nr:FAD/NAD-binding domain-containing protein [Crassisporium funariophilum]